MKKRWIILIAAIIVLVVIRLALPLWLENQASKKLSQIEGYTGVVKNVDLRLYSRLELVNPDIQFLIEPKIPSFRTQVRLRSGTLITLYDVHPRHPGLKRPDVEAGGVEKDDEEEAKEAIDDGKSNH